MSRCVSAEGTISALISTSVSDISSKVESSKSDDVRLRADGGRLSVWSEVLRSDGAGDSLGGKEECRSICLAVMPDSNECISRR